MTSLEDLERKIDTLALEVRAGFAESRARDAELQLRATELISELRSKS